MRGYRWRLMVVAVHHQPVSFEHKNLIYIIGRCQLAILPDVTKCSEYNAECQPHDHRHDYAIFECHTQC